MATLTVYPAENNTAPFDGYVQRDLGAGSPETFATLRGAAGNGSSTAPGADRVAALDGSSTTDMYKRLNRSIFGFDLSSIAGASVSSAVFSISPTFKANGLGSDDIHLASATPASNSAIANGDYSNIGTTSYGSITYANWTADGGYDDITLNSDGLTFLGTKLGTYCFFGLKLNWDINNTTTGLTWANGAATRYEAIYAEGTGTSRDPKLVVTYTMGTTTNDSRGAVVTGQDTANSTRSARLAGGTYSTDRTTGGTATASGENTGGGEGVDKAFDDNDSTKWLAFSFGPHWIKYDFGSGVTRKIQRYSIVSGNDAPERDPVNWVLQGSNDDSSWTDLHTVTGYPGWSSRNQLKDFEFTNDVHYRYMRLYITAITSGSIVQLSELRMYELYDTQSSERPATLIGKDTANSERGAITTGAGSDSANAERPAVITGKDTSSSERPAVVTGKDTSNAERPAVLTGKDTSSSERPAVITGKDTSSSERPAVTTGKDSSSSERAATLLGRDTANNERPAVITGKDTSNSERAATITGEGGTNSDRPATTVGQDSANAERPAIVTGKDTANAERAATLLGTDTNNSQRSAVTVGQQSDASERSGHLRGTDTANSSRPAILFGVETAVAEIMAHLWGKDTAFDERGGHMFGVFVANSERGAVITGKLDRGRPIVLPSNDVATILGSMQSRTVIPGVPATIL